MNELISSWPQLFARMTNRNISVIECEFKTKVPTNPQQREQQGGEAAGGKDS
jgi:hypothetical protein